LRLIEFDPFGVVRTSEPIIVGRDLHFRRAPIANAESFACRVVDFLRLVDVPAGMVGRWLSLSMIQVGTVLSRMFAVDVEEFVHEA